MAKRTAPPPLRARLHPRIPDELGDAPAVAGDDLDWDEVAVEGIALPAELDVVSVRSSRLRRVRLTGIRIGRLDATDVVLEDCELSGAILATARLERVELHRCRMSGVELSRAELRDVLVSGCRLDEANLRAATFDSVDIEDSDLRRADLYGARLTRSNLLRDDLSDADLSKCTATRLALHGSNLLGVKGGAALAGSIISRDQVMTLAPSLFEAVGITVDDDFRDAASPG